MEAVLHLLILFGVHMRNKRNYDKRQYKLFFRDISQITRLSLLLFIIMY
nr:MAG TPA: hypothetical protein [Caudoviricetes sp.]